MLTAGLRLYYCSESGVDNDKLMLGRRGMRKEVFAALQADQFDVYAREAAKSIEVEGADNFWTELAAMHPKQINLVDVLNKWPPGRDYQLITVLIPVLAYLPQLTQEDYRKLLEVIALRNASAYSVAERVAKHLGRDHALALDFAEEMEAGQEVTEALQMAWAESFAAGAPRVASVYILGYFEEHRRLPTEVKLLLLGLPESELLEQSAFVALGEAMTDAVMHPPAQDQYVWLTLVKLALIVPYASDKLMEAVNSGRVDAGRALAGALTRLDAPEWSVRKLPLQNVLGSLVESAMSDESALAYIDHVIAVLMVREHAKAQALVFLGSLGVKNEDFTEILHAAFQAAFRDEAGFTTLLTKLLLQQGANFNAIKHLIRFYQIEGNPVRLDDETIIAADTQRLVKLVRRILSLTFHGPTMCMYAGEILRISGLGQTGQHLGIQMFKEIYAEYPGAAEDYLREKVKEVGADTPAGAIYNDFMDHILEWREFLNKLPEVKELRATEQERIALNSLGSRVNRDIQRGAEEQSIFASIVSKSVIVQGSRFAAYIDDRPPMVTQMFESSHSIELPSSELADPLRGLIRRRKLLGDAQ